ncbi:flagellar hook-length control protein FliK [Paenibacillus motobuensis]|uniref:flagellar hook-length control protein FliK n=1 Tax=Paenibacillus TaxID=44249 RepID=UPI002042125E|nr:MULTISPECIES: flagellar hook-length control protein FliK [Paenibacillus]MCM3038305.1 flagellar hook-length control protein FliK [Paenibacillus lutimineralis]MCM3645409.1 flagellar hook-length control protein FliK [Paenibacillus motobuensis]
MNIGPLLRSMLGDARPGEPRTLELKAGQVVRGTVLSVSEDGQEAVIQVQGVKLHAALETPLQQGQTTLLQVQPQVQDGQMMLKPINQPVTSGLSSSSLAGLLSEFGLENTAANRDLIQSMQASGIPLTKENVTQLLSLTALKPSSVPLSEWVQAAGIALNRGLPLTGETVGSLHQAIFGPPLHVLLSNLEEQLAAFIGGRLNVPGQTGGQANGAQVPMAPGAEMQNTGTGQLAANAAVPNAATPGASAGGSAAAAIAAQGAAQGSGVAGANEGVINPAATMSQTVMDGAGKAVPFSASSLPMADGSLASTVQGAGTQTTDALLSKLQSLLTQLRATIAQDAVALPGRGQGGAELTAAERAVGLAAGTSTGASAAAAAPPGEAPAGASPLAAPPTTVEPWVGRVLKLLGAEHEQQLLRRAVGAQQEPAPAAGEVPRGAAGGTVAPGGAGGSGPMAAPQEGPALPHSGAGGAVPGAQAAGAAAGLAPPEALAAHKSSPLMVSDTLKGLLMQVLSQDDVPAPLLDTARQLASQLTGQQLLLTTDRTAPFAQVTLFLPFIGPDGEQTASVHIESRRGRKGLLDADNCRLWFDLQMKALGQIMVDVQVADKKVLLKIYSENELAGTFLESRQDEVRAALDSAGYRLLALNAERLIKAVEEDGANDLTMSQAYAPSSYRGVDYRI